MICLLQKLFHSRASITLMHDVLMLYIYYSYGCKFKPSKSLGRKLSQSLYVLNLVPTLEFFNILLKTFESLPIFYFFGKTSKSTY